MFGKRGLFSQKPALPKDDRVFSRELWQGDMGDFLRKHGFAPDDPKNVVARQEPRSAQLAASQADSTRLLAKLSAAAGCSVGALHLLPPKLWSETHHGAFLLQGLDMSPYRPWNTSFLPLDNGGAERLGLPMLPRQDHAHLPPDVVEMINIVREIFLGQASPEATSDFSPNVIEARANLRAFAFGHAVAGGLVDKDVVIRSRETFVFEPGALQHPRNRGNLMG